MKSLLICTSLLLLSGCHLFEDTPPKVVEGQRAVYQGILLAEENDRQIIKRYVQDTKMAITYHVNWVYEPKIDAIRRDPDLTREVKSEKLAKLERERQAQLDSTFADIDKIAGKMLSQALKNHELTKKLAASIYNYLSTSPIEIDNLSFWIEKLKQASEAQN